MREFYVDGVLVCQAKKSPFHAGTVAALQAKYPNHEITTRDVELVDTLTKLNHALVDALA